MLDEYKQIYMECANIIPEWRSLSKSDLANLYIDHKDKPISDSYFAALMLKYWNLIGHFYYKQGIKTASEEDCYDWLIEGLTAALDQCAWRNENNVLYHDEKGPEKAIMVCIMSYRANYYQYIKYDKRRLNYNNLSLDLLEENSSDGFFIPYLDKHLELNDYLKDLIKERFNKKDYFYCFFLDCLINSNILEGSDDNWIISLRKFNNCITNLEEEYYSYFSKTYDIELKKVKKAFLYIKIMPNYRIQYNITRITNELKKDLILKDLLKGELIC